ncbi:MAG: hypothetical protein COX77_03705 [Candidatus Komeilibacteria bacterium CG_4_10_14_0_2_um_filter_37_10]|uniref:Uncharacterized protein n=1 Tax=Candidatus Komeilibacteria bacterium CG_4_10_14_0_2_um_filter_37_10 TaxID=1974470 RepID=A0A2M7VDZ7_9BACT|nr:MAG: hypothetical protein COX77_03705 [Candidatus Komeilibacteria bacterium CG_4_10_14_0_2_um_filter_37_10]
MKKFMLSAALFALFLTGCSLFEKPGDNPVGPQDPTALGKATSILLELDRTTQGLNKVSWTDSVWIHSNMFLNTAQTATETKEVLIQDSLRITTAVNEKTNYVGRLMTPRGFLLNGFKLAGSLPQNWSMSENEGPYFHFGVSPTGSLIQGTNNVKDTVRIKVRIYAPNSRAFYMNGTMTRFRNVNVSWQTDPGYYAYEFLTLPGIQKYDFWEGGGNNSIDSLVFGNLRLTNISGSHIRFQVNAGGTIELLDSVTTLGKLALSKVVSYELVKAYLFDSQYGNREFVLTDNNSEYSTIVALAQNIEIFCRIEGYNNPDTTACFLNVAYGGFKLHHLITYASNKYRFKFRLVDQVVLQDTNNVILAISTKP